jgi:hydroxymethylpyrimidine/phosphomethylpyrimidine kinase
MGGERYRKNRDMDIKQMEIHLDLYKDKGKKSYTLKSKDLKKDFRYPSILSIAGLDPSGCAGLLIDIRVIRSLGFHPCGVVTALTLQNTCHAEGYEVVPHDLMRKQITEIFKDLNVLGVKIGLLNSLESAEAVEMALGDFDGFVVLDPVIKSTTGLNFFETDVKNIFERLAGVVDVITPNIFEAELISYLKIKTVDEAKKAAKKISEMFECSTIITGGGLGGRDVVFERKTGEVFTVEAEFSPVEIRGTGCVYSTALTCYLSKGNKLVDAARLARVYLLETVKRAKPAGKCHPCVDPWVFEG